MYASEYITSEVYRVAKLQAQELQPKLSDTTSVLLDPEDPAWQRSSIRFSDVNRLNSAAIFQPSCEADVVIIVQHAVKHGIQFVGKSGGHSSWSNIKDGWVIDFVNMREVELDIDAETVRVGPGVDAKTLNVELARFLTDEALAAGESICVVTPAAATVGVIPATLGGGKSIITGLYGLACDSLVSARVVTSKHGLVVASTTENSDLFWALKGAGQFFGLVTQITMKVFPMQEKILDVTYIFPAAKIGPVADVLQALSTEENRNSQWSAILMAPPGPANLMLVVSTKHFRPEAEAGVVIAPLAALQPLQTIRKFIDYSNSTNGSDAFNKPGGMRTMFSGGLQEFKAEKLVSGVQMWTEMVAKWPSTAGSIFIFDWMSTSGMREFEGQGSAYSHRDCSSWIMVYMSGPDAESGRAAAEYGEKFVYMCQEGQIEEAKALFPNHTRVHSLEQRYRGKERLEKLKELKRIWDPEGVFTKQLLG